MKIIVKKKKKFKLKLQNIVIRIAGKVLRYIDALMNRATPVEITVTQPTPFIRVLVLNKRDVREHNKSQLSDERFSHERPGLSNF